MIHIVIKDFFKILLFSDVPLFENRATEWYSLAKRNELLRVDFCVVCGGKGIKSWKANYLPSIQYLNDRSSHCGTAETSLTRNHEVTGSIPGLTQWVKDPALP